MRASYGDGTSGRHLAIKMMAMARLCRSLTLSLSFSVSPSFCARFLFLALGAKGFCARGREYSIKHPINTGLCQGMPSEIKRIHYYLTLKCLLSLPKFCKSMRPGTSKQEHLPPSARQPSSAAVPSMGPSPPGASGARRRASSELYLTLKCHHIQQCYANSNYLHHYSKLTLGKLI